MNRPVVATLRAHHSSVVAIILATAPLKECPICELPLAQHPKCFWCTVLLGPEHAEHLPVGYEPGDRRPVECDYCYFARTRRRVERVAS